MARALEALETPYAPRALAERIAHANCPVAILEGPHGVGKTALVKNDPAFSRFRYVTLADEETYRQASECSAEWAASLSRPVIIDEAHRIDSLVPTIQQIAPKRTTKGPAFILVSPQALHSEEPEEPKKKQKKDGTTEAAAAQKPSEAPENRKKARKPPNPQHFTLFPMTQAEICERPGCVIDDLFDQDPIPGFHSSCTRSDLRTMMRTGGFPYRVMRPVHSKLQGRDPRSQEDLQGILDNGEPQTDIERMIERSIMKKVLTTPGLHLKVEAVARSCYVDTATFSAHMGSFLDHFLIHCLFNLDKKRSRKRSFAKTRIHPMDTTFAIEMLRDAGYDISADPFSFGKVLRAFCVNQLVPAAQWASEPTECCHWKKFDRRIREVDLVLSRKDRLIGIKVHNSVSARSDELGPLRILAEDERFLRGFIIYLGSITLQLSQNIWAIPVSALWEYEAFHPVAKESSEDENEDEIDIDELENDDAEEEGEANEEKLTEA